MSGRGHNTAARDVIGHAAVGTLAVTMERAASDALVTSGNGATALRGARPDRVFAGVERIATHVAGVVTLPGLAMLGGNRRELTEVVRRLMEDSNRAEHEARMLAFALRRSRVSGLRALVPLLAGRSRRPGPLRQRARRRPRRNRPRGRRPPAEGRRPGREVVRPEDAFFLYTQTRNVAQQVGGVALLKDSSLTFSEVREEVERRLVGLPNLRRRLAPPQRWWRRPSWVAEDETDVGDHLKERVIGADGQPGTFTELVDDFFSSPVSLAKAPWEMHFVRGLDGGAAALVVKLHHAMGDGFAAIDTLSGLLDDARDANESADAAVGKASTDVGRLALTAARLRTAALVLGGLWTLGRSGRAPRTSLNGTMRTPSRHFVSLSLPSAEVRGVARALEATKTELVLTVVADALHRLLAERGEAPRSLLAMVPRTMRTEKTRKAPGNWTGGARVSLPAAEMSPLARLRETQRRVRRSLRHGEPQASRFLMRAMGVLPAPVEARVARWSYRSRWFNLIVSVIPGPRRPYSFVGVRLEEVYPVLPLADEVGLAIGVLSWGDRITVGMTTDVNLLSDADRLVEEMRASFSTLEELAAG